MASPTLSSICCMLQSDMTFPITQLAPYFLSPSFSLTSLVFSLLGVLGAIHQTVQNHVILRRAAHSDKLPSARVRQVLLWLAVADLLANTAVVLRSSVWLAELCLTSHVKINLFTSRFCIATSVVSQCCYLTTYMCTLLYTVEVLLTIRGTSGPVVLYGLFSWLLPAFLSLLGCLLLYLPDNRCHARSTMLETLYRHLPNYVCVYVPLFSVMLASPVIVGIALNQLRTRIVHARNRFGQRERQMLFCLRFKLVCVLLGFYLCWLPNVAGGLLVWLSWPRVPISALAVFWYLMAAMNPLQALFNSVMHHGWEPGLPSVSDWFKSHFRRLCCVSAGAASMERLPLVADSGSLTSPQQYPQQYHTC